MSTHLVSSACCSKHTHVFKCCSLEGFWTLQAHSTVITLTSAKKGLITTQFLMQEQVIAAHSQPTGCSQAVKSSLGLLQCCRKAQKHLHLPIFCLNHRRSVVDKKIGRGLMDHCSWEPKRSRGRTEQQVPPAERVITRFLSTGGQVLSYPEQPHQSSPASLAMTGWHFTNETESFGAGEWLLKQEKTKSGIFKILYAPN